MSRAGARERAPGLNKLNEETEFMVIEHTVIGKKLPMVDAKEKISGNGEYIADMTLPGMQPPSPRPDPEHRCLGGRKSPRGSGHSDRPELPPAQVRHLHPGRDPIRR